MAGLLGLPTGALLKSFPVIRDGTLILALVRGDHQVNEIKLANAVGGEIRPAHPEEIERSLGPIGFVGPVGADVRVILDSAVEPGGYVTGANRPDTHLRGVEPGRDFVFERGDIRSVVEGDTVGGQPIRIEPAIEIGNIFKLGTRYSEALGATFLDESGDQRPVIMGSYGIGPARIAAAAVEQRGGDTAIPWPRAIAPWDVEVVAIGKPDSDEVRTALAIAAELEEQGIEVVVDDRDSSPGAKFADADLIGCPLRLTVGRKGLERGVVEGRGSNGDEHEFPIADAAALAGDAWRAIH